MVIRVQVADAVTGDRLQTLPTSSVSWEQRILSPEGMRVELTLQPRAHQRLDIRNATMEAKTSLIVTDGDTVVGAGPIGDRDYDDDRGRLTIQADGVWEHLHRVYVHPAHVTATNLTVEVDGTDEPNPAVATKFVGRSWPQIVRGILEQAMSLEGGMLPLVFGPDGVGAHDITYDASSFKSVGEALRDITKRQDGPEIQFVPRIVNNKLQYLVRVGDDVTPEVTSPTVHVFDFTPVKRSVRALKVRSSGKNLASVAWGTGGRQSSKALFARAFSPILLDAGYPRMEMLSSAHSTVVEQPTLDQYAQQDLLGASAPLEWWSWQTHANKHPRLADLNVGDYCRVHLRDNRYLPDSPPEGYLRRIVALSGNGKSRWVNVVTDEVSTW